jgi:hypothetical protein
MPAQPRQYVSPLVVGDLAGRPAEHLEALRGHHLDQRRYMVRFQA